MNRPPILFTRTSSHLCRRAFSLVELSIVLVILGLLVGGILSGQSLIRAAQLRSIITEEQRWFTATQNFRDKYFALPGDMTTASKFWGTSATGCTDAAQLGATGTCNGDGDGKIIWCASGVPYACKEMYWYWQQLALAGILEGKYTGYGIWSATDTKPGINSPMPKFGGAMWDLMYLGDLTSTSSAFFWSISYGNTYRFTKDYNNNTVQDGGILRPEEAWNIDTKMDDGKPGRGKVISTAAPAGYAAAWNNTCTTGASSLDFLTATYVLTNTTNSCILYFINIF